MTPPDKGGRTDETILSRFRANAAWLARFSAVGLVGATVYYSALWAMVEKLGLPVLVATSIAFVLVTIENYALHHRWTFASIHSHAVAFPRFVFMNIVGFWINFGIMAAGLRYLSLSYLLVQAFAIVAVVAWNFVVSSYWIFREIKQPNG